MRMLLIALLAVAACTSGSGGTSGGGGGSSTTSSSGGGSAGFEAGIPPGTERGGNLERTGVYQDPSFTEAAVSAPGGLHADPSFDSVSWTGPVYSQPLYAAATASTRAMVLVTTASNEVYAVDAATGALLWAVHQLDPPIDPSTMACPGNVSPLGSLGTGVIDPLARVLYVAAGISVAGAPHQRIYALDLDHGTLVSGWPIDLEGLPMTLANGGGGKFQSQSENQRGALLLLGGTLYVPYGGLWGDCGQYHGVVAAVPTANPSQVTLWATSAPSGSGIWGPSGIASDGSSLYVATGNTNDDPAYPTAWNDANSEAVMRLSAGVPPVFSGAAADYFAPADPAQDWYVDDTEDQDLGSSGVVLFAYPGSAVHPQLAFAIGKTGNAYLLDRANLGGLSTGLSEIADASAEVFGSMAAYTTPTATYVVANASGNGSSCRGTVAAFAVSGDPPQLGGGWCVGNGGWGSPIVTTSDGSHDFLVWVTDANLTAVDGDSGLLVGAIAISGGIQAYEHWVTPLVAQGALYLAGNTELLKFDP